MPLEDRIPGSAADWLARAKGDLAIASADLPQGAFLEDLCFHAQQAVEKAFKAVYVYKGIAFRYTHDLDELACKLKNNGIDLPSEVMEATILTAYAWEARYPGVTEPVIQEEYEEAVAMASVVVEWADMIISREC